MQIVFVQNTKEDFKDMMVFKKNHQDLIKTVLEDAEIVVLEESEVLKHPKISDTDIFICQAPFLQNYSKQIFPKLVWTHIVSAGADQLPQNIKESDVLITNSSGVHPIPISQHVFGFIFMFSRGLHIAYRAQIEEKKWVREYDKDKISEIQDQTIGIVGFGRIGQEISNLAQKLGMKVLKVTSKEGNLDELLSQSDYIVNALPLTPKTQNFFDKEKFGKIKKSAYFINIGRGKTVDENALIEVLQKGEIAGAGLDVFQEEPLPESSPLWNLKNVIITPHYSGWTPHYMDRVIAIFCENLKAYLDKKEMPNLVDKTRGY